MSREYVEPEGVRDFRKEADELIAKGYCRTSNKYRNASRIDRADWVHFLAKDLRRAPADFYVPGEDHPTGGWCDFYRRVHSQDSVSNITPGVFVLLPSSDHNPIGYRE